MNLLSSDYLVQPTPKPTPPRIVEPDGTVHTGWFERPFEVANLDDAPAAHLLSRLRGTPLDSVERGLRRWRLKQWHYTSVVTDRTLLACAIVDAGYVGSAFAYLVDRSSGEKWEYSAVTPGATGITIAANSIDGTSRMRWPGFGSITIENRKRAGVRRLDLDLEGRLGASHKPPLRVQLDIRDAGFQPQPVVVVEQTQAGRWLYTHKCYGLEAGGLIECGDLREEVPMGAALAGIDYNRGFRPRETFWNWAAGCGRMADGTIVAFNLTAHRRPGHPAPNGAGEAGDCALWLGDELVKVPRVEFEYDPRHLLGEWRVRDDEGLVDLRFAPEGDRSAKINLGLLVSRYQQPYGAFRGELRDRAGKVYPIKDLYGVVEQHFARW